MRSTLLAIALVAVCWTRERGPALSVPCAPPARSASPEPRGPVVKVAVFPASGRSGRVSACISPPRDFWSSGRAPAAYFVEPEGDILLLVDPMQGRREVPLICGDIDHLPPAGSRLALGAPGNARRVAHRFVDPTDLL